MRTAGSFTVFDRDGELVDPNHTAVLIIDMQNDFVTPGGHFHRAGKDVASMADIVSPLRAFADTARLAGANVVFVRQYTLPDGRSDSPAWAAFKTRDGKPPDYTVPGTWGHDIVDGLPVHDGDDVIPKPRPSAFLHTNLDLVLRAHRTQTVIVVGVTTEGCVESTVRDASYHDYYVVVAEDLVASPNPELHEGSMRLMRSRYRVLPSRDIVAVWRA